MAISIHEQKTLRCISCGGDFDCDVWSLVDSVERPDLAQALYDGVLNEANCPHCGTSNQSQIALLFHDPERRRVYFAVPAGAAEHRWREQVQSLLYELVSQLPEESRHAYLGDVQVDQEIAGVRRSMLRRQRGRSSGKPAFGKPIVMPGAVEAPVEHIAPQAPARQAPAPGSVLFDAIELAVGAESLDDLREVARRNPVLLSDDTDAALLQLAETAFNQGDRDMGSVFRSVRQALADLRAGREQPSEPRETQAAATQAPAAEGPQEQRLSTAAYQALLHAASVDELIDAARVHPALLDSWADDDLIVREEAALDEGNERLANLIEERRDSLAELRLTLVDDEPLQQAIQALLDAKGAEAVEQVLTTYPALLTDSAQQALHDLIHNAKAAGNAVLGKAAEERRQWLQHVRAGLET
jgi:hypothetical protein